MQSTTSTIHDNGHLYIRPNLARQKRAMSKMIMDWDFERAVLYWQPWHNCNTLQDIRSLVSHAQDHGARVSLDYDSHGKCRLMIYRAPTLFVERAE